MEFGGELVWGFGGLVVLSFCWYWVGELDWDFGVFGWFFPLVLGGVFITCFFVSFFFSCLIVLLFEYSTSYRELFLAPVIVDCWIVLRARAV